jgi:hypothetical protein
VGLFIFLLVLAVAVVATNQPWVQTVQTMDMEAVDEQGDISIYQEQVAVLVVLSFLTTTDLRGNYGSKNIRHK